MALAQSAPSPLAQIDGVGRRSFARIPEVQPVPNLIQIQRDSFSWFLGGSARAVRRDLTDLRTSPGATWSWSLLSRARTASPVTSFGEPKLREDECRLRDSTFAAPLRVRMRLTIKSGEAEGELKEQTIFMGDFPLMTRTAPSSSTAPSASWSASLCAPLASTSRRTRTTTSGRPLCMGKLIPSRGAWLEFETSNRDVLSVKVDRKRKIPVTTLIRALGGCPRLADQARATNEELLELYEDDRQPSRPPLHPVRRSTRIRPRPPRKRCSSSTAACARAIRRTPENAKLAAATRCSSASAATTSVVSAATSCTSGSTLARADRRAHPDAA